MLLLPTHTNIDFSQAKLKVCHEPIPAATVICQQTHTHTNHVHKSQTFSFCTHRICLFTRALRVDNSCRYELSSDHFKPIVMDESELIKLH